MNHACLKLRLVGDVNLPLCCTYRFLRLAYCLVLAVVAAAATAAAGLAAEGNVRKGIIGCLPKSHTEVCNCLQIWRLSASRVRQIIFSWRWLFTEIVNLYLNRLVRGSWPHLFRSLFILCTVVSLLRQETAFGSDFEVLCIWFQSLSLSLLSLSCSLSLSHCLSHFHSFSLCLFLYVSHFATLSQSLCLFVCMSICPSVTVLLIQRHTNSE